MKFCYVERSAKGYFFVVCSFWKCCSGNRAEVGGLFWLPNFPWSVVQQYINSSRLYPVAKPGSYNPSFLKSSFFCAKCSFISTRIANVLKLLHLWSCFGKCCSLPDWLSESFGIEARLSFSLVIKLTNRFLMKSPSRCHWYCRCHRLSLIADFWLCCTEVSRLGFTRMQVMFDTPACLPVKNNATFFVATLSYVNHGIGS